MKQKPLKKAVALAYQPEEHEAPVVIAKGTGITAQNILEKANEHGILIQEDQSLVEVLSQLELGQQIPAELYQLVAEVLSFIYKADKKLR